MKASRQTKENGAAAQFVRGLHEHHLRHVYLDYCGADLIDTLLAWSETLLGMGFDGRYWVSASAPELEGRAQPRMMLHPDTVWPHVLDLEVHKFPLHGPTGAELFNAFPALKHLHICSGDQEMRMVYPPLSAQEQEPKWPTLMSAFGPLPYLHGLGLTCPIDVLSVNSHLYAHDAPNFEYHLPGDYNARFTPLVPELEAFLSLVQTANPRELGFSVSGNLETEFYKRFRLLMEAEERKKMGYKLRIQKLKIAIFWDDNLEIFSSFRELLAIAKALADCKIPFFAPVMYAPINIDNFIADPANTDPVVREQAAHDYNAGVAAVLGRQMLKTISCMLYVRIVKLVIHHSDNSTHKSWWIATEPFVPPATGVDDGDKRFRRAEEAEALELMQNLSDAL